MNTRPVVKLIDRLSQTIDFLSEWTGRYLSWLVLALALLVGYDVAMRYLFQSGSIALQELQWHLFSIIFLLGAAYTFKHDEHVRLDLLYQSRFMNDYRRAWVNLLGGLFFLIPFCVLIIICAWPFLLQSYQYAEGSPDPGGLSHRWLLKAAIPLGFLLLMLQGLADILKNLKQIISGKRT